MEIIGGDLSLDATRDAVFEALDSAFPSRVLGAVVHNADQFVGGTLKNSAYLSDKQLQLGEVSLLGEDGRPDFDHMRYYQRLYGEAFVDLCERALPRMGTRGSLVGISSSGVGVAQRPEWTYKSHGSGECVMEYAKRLYALAGAGQNVNCNVIVPGPSGRSRTSTAT